MSRWCQTRRRRRVDVTIDGKPFTSYIYPTTLKKPTLFPLRTAKGTLVTRGYPLETRPNERVDHPHHVGLWLNHGERQRPGLLEQLRRDFARRRRRRWARSSTAAWSWRKSGANHGELAVEADWMTPDGKPAARARQTRYVFRGAADSRTIDRTTTLTALDRAGRVRDSKEGFFGMRVTRALEQPDDKPEVFTDASGKPTPRAV